MAFHLSSLLKPQLSGRLSDGSSVVQQWNGVFTHVCSSNVIVFLAKHVLICSQQASQFSKLVVGFAYLTRLFQQRSGMKWTFEHRSGQAPGSTLLAWTSDAFIWSSFTGWYIPITVPAFSSRGSIPRFIQRTVTSLLVRGLSSVAATATPLSLLSERSISSTGPLGSEFNLQLTCTSLSSGRISVLMICTL